MTPHNECFGRAWLRGSMQQVLPQPRISLVWRMTVQCNAAALTGPMEPSLSKLTCYPLSLMRLLLS